jgi:hypothetical protein
MLIRIVWTEFVLVGLLLGAMPAACAERSQPPASSPDLTLERYFAGLAKADLDQVAECFEPRATDFILPRPIVVTKYKVTKRVVYGQHEVDKWNRAGIVPAALLGDVELEVREVVEGRAQMYSYNFRLVGATWKIVSHDAWDVPD